MAESGRHVSAVKGIDDGSTEAAGLASAQQRNRALVGLLRTLAARNSTESLY